MSSKLAAYTEICNLSTKRFVDAALSAEASYYACFDSTEEVELRRRANEAYDALALARAWKEQVLGVVRDAFLDSDEASEDAPLARGADMTNATAVLWFHVSGRSGLRFISDARVQTECDEHRTDQELAEEPTRIGPSNIETLLSMWNDNGSGGLNAHWFFVAVRRVELLSPSTSVDGPSEAALVVAEVLRQ